jgi:hypothetical protein
MNPTPTPSPAPAPTPRTDAVDQQAQRIVTAKPFGSSTADTINEIVALYSSHAHGLERSVNAAYDCNQDLIKKLRAAEERAVRAEEERDEAKNGRQEWCYMADHRGEQVIALKARLSSVAEDIRATGAVEALEKANCALREDRISACIIAAESNNRVWGITRDADFVKNRCDKALSVSEPAQTSLTALLSKLRSDGAQGVEHTTTREEQAAVDKFFMQQFHKNAASAPQATAGEAALTSEAYFADKDLFCRYVHEQVNPARLKEGLSVFNDAAANRLYDIAINGTHRTFYSVHPAKTKETSA